MGLYCNARGCQNTGWCKQTRQHFCNICKSRNSDHRRIDCPNWRTGQGMGTLYHQTDGPSGAAIQASREMFPGTGGRLGGAIYFAPDIPTTDRLAHRKGYVVTARVFLGRQKVISSQQATQHTFESLRREGYDSVFVQDRNEYAVFHKDHVKVMSVAKR
ncbi:unnamed protein product [Vitrella brassicaformis CCMP3155]|uniref:PARP catalytic domain-containing protein n=1 Tax=Vitrella brassicaformis (strain CCMP3155) TaxID=1169540 RepID=A0A0G4EIP0_VITBC|nr:unnamed protein product [Vitrella brassicaformis CCMP3155]|eukprot:CEL95762.1 unnamed protein product [Vitrella brassicaformis CCMP3155]